MTINVSDCNDYDYNYLTIGHGLGASGQGARHPTGVLGIPASNDGARVHAHDTRQEQRRYQ